jgi:hypothetical protein
MRFRWISGIEVVLDRIGYAKFRESRRNGATADFTLPKSIRNKNIAKAMV